MFRHYTGKINNFAVYVYVHLRVTERHEHKTLNNPIFNYFMSNFERNKSVMFSKYAFEYQIFFFIFSVFSSSGNKKVKFFWSYFKHLFGYWHPLNILPLSWSMRLTIPSFLSFIFPSSTDDREHFSLKYCQSSTTGTTRFLYTPHHKTLVCASLVTKLLYGLSIIIVSMD